MGALFLFICFLAVVLVLAWNFVPGIREKFKGWTTILEGSLAAFLYLFDQVSQGLQEAMKAGWVPKELITYLPLIFFAWVILKRFQTKTPVGKK